MKPANGTGKDANIATETSTVNYGNHIDFEGVTWTCSGHLCLGRSLIEFDLSSIPAGSVINLATLNLFANLNATNGIAGQPTYGTDNSGVLRRITQSWNEMTVTWANQPSTTTQNEVILPQSTGTAQDYSLNVTALTQDILNNPNSGFGFMISEQNETTWYNSLIFCSSDYSDASKAPELIVTYTPPSTGMICFELQPDAATGKDANIATETSTVNYGNHIDFEGVTWTCSGHLCLGRSLIEFDLSSIPSTATIDSAFIYLYANLNASNGISGEPTYGSDNAGYLRRITQSWNEMSVTWDTQPQTATQDQVAIPQSVTTADSYKLDIKNLVQTSVQNPNSSYGFMIMEQNETTWYNSLIFGSSDSPDAGIHPKIKVCYTPADGIAENDFSSFAVYPNPFSDLFTITDKINSLYSVDVYNALGVLVAHADAGRMHSVTIDAAFMSSGIYFAKVLTNHGTTVRKLVKG